MRILVLRVHGTGRSRTYCICQMFHEEASFARWRFIATMCCPQLHCGITSFKHQSVLSLSKYIWKPMGSPLSGSTTSPPQWKKLHALTDSRITWSNSGSFFAMDGPRQAGRRMRHGTWVYCFQTCLQFEASSM